MLRDYEESIPGTGHLIVKEFEENSKHRRLMESKLVGASVDWQKRGQLFAAGIGMAAVVGGIGLAAVDKELWGLVYLVVAVGGLSGKWLKRRLRAVFERFRAPKELAEKPD